MAMKILLRILVSAAALGVAAWMVPGIVLTGHDTAAKVLTLLIVAVIFGLVNAVLKPVIKTVGCAFYILTLGLVAIVVNGLLLWLTSYIAYDKLHEPFHITGFVAAVEGALIVGVVSWLIHLALGDEAELPGRPQRPRPRRAAEVIHLTAYTLLVRCPFAQSIHPRFWSTPP
jgi:putative membrane protein